MDSPAVRRATRALVAVALAAALFLCAAVLAVAERRGASACAPEEIHLTDCRFCSRGMRYA